MLADGKFEEAQKKLISTISYIDSARSKGVLHKNNASRKIARLTMAYTQATANVKVAEAPKAKAEVKAVEVKEEPAKKVVKKATAKTTEEKPAKKTTTKKAEPKTTAKKTTKKETK